MVNRIVLHKRIEKAKEYIDFLKNIQTNYSLSEFENDPMIYGSSERFLHLTIEALIDIGNHIIADENLGKVQTYRDVAKILRDNGYIDDETSQVFIKIIGFRNILVHDYMELDLDLVYEIIKNNLSDLENILEKYILLI